ncbi:glycosyl transferase family 1 [Pseudomaricurvus alcaniphilus]|uniref:glycosyltransferase n=1 Tax=Pseudomaricurvus alcaniphilus TaxID=1166482 RepID=UPI00140AC6CF|nr:nucleotide disphospho-sugar-binding domain-containing protein [Pseudomaricurvus alcaniphilus]NHN36751.1 glycosyl transferase family 1 [Pseudomaricurvus alcaniphilus]
MSENTKRKPRVLFIAEAVTLAHVARMAVLAQGLEQDGFEVCFAADPRYNKLFPGLPADCREIWSIASADFTRALAQGRPVYSSAILERYVEDDLALIDSVRPDYIVGDFRLSLSVSARLRQVPYLSVSNFYWSPLANLACPIPEHPLVGLLGLSVAQFLFSLVRPVAFAHHAAPVNRVRKKFGLKPLGHNLNRAYTDSDMLLLADIPELAPGLELASNHRFIGPILWSPEQALPDWWETLEDSIPCVYITLGSSGRNDLLPAIINALQGLPVQLLVTTSGNPPPDIQASNVYYADFLPGDIATAKADLVICNGGSLSTYEALRCGVPVIGIAGNLDQHLNMRAVDALGAGVYMRNDQLDLLTLKHEVARKLAGQERTCEVASRLQAKLASVNPCRELTAAFNSV